MKYEITSLDVAEVSRLKVTFRLVHPARRFFAPTFGQERPSLLVIGFAGVYRHGCRGNPDGVFIHAMVELGLRLWCPNGFVLDFSSLSYRWGDMMELVLDAGVDLFPQGKLLRAVVVDDELCEEALQSLVRGIKSDEPLVDQQEFFYELDDAIACLFAKIDK